MDEHFEEMKPKAEDCDPAGLAVLAKVLDHPVCEYRVSERQLVDQ